MTTIVISDDPTALKVIGFHLSGLEHGAYRPTALADWLPDVRVKLIDHLRGEWFNEANVPADEDGPATSRSTFTFHAFRGARPIKLPATPEAWNRLLRDLGRGRVDSVMVATAIRPPASDPFATWISAMSVDVIAPLGQVKGRASLGSLVTGHEDYWDPRRQRDALTAWLDLAKRLDAPWGHATLDIGEGAGMTTAHEQLAGSYRDDYETKGRGYHWGTLLSEGHIRTLGGAEAVLRSAPVYRIEELASVGGRALVYLQLTPDIRAFSDDELLALKNFLRPILRPEDPQFTYYGPKPRFVPDE